VALIVLSSILVGIAVALGASALVDVLDLLQKNYQADLITRMQRLGMATNHVPVLLRIRWGLALGVFLIMTLVARALPVGVVLAWGCYVGVPLVLEFLLESHRIRLRDQIVVLGRNLAAQIRAGLPLIKGLASVSEDLEEPMGSVIRQMVKQCESGLSTRQALLDLKERLQLDAMSILVIALVVSEEKGGKITDVIDRIVHSLEESQRLERKKDSDTAAGRLLVRLLTAFPFVFLALFYFLDPEGTQLVFTLVEGQIILGGVGLLVYISWRWAQSILGAVE
jgi:tight adherence protein B